MKTKSIFILMVSVIYSLNSCTIRVPLSSNTQKLHDDALRVQPYYSVKKKTLTNAGLMFPIFGAIAFTSFYFKTKSSDGVVYTPEQLAESRKTGTFLALGGLGLGLISILAHKSKVSEQRTNININSWLSKYGNKNNENYKLLSNDSYSYLIVPKNNITSYEAEEDRLDRAAFLRVTSGEIGAFADYISTRPLNSKKYSDVLKLREECEYYYKAMNATLTEYHTFSNMLSDCDKYLGLYPQFRGNEAFFKYVTKRRSDILSIPVEVREQRVSMIRTQADELRKEERIRAEAKTTLLLGLLELFLDSSNSNNSNNNREQRQCNKCFGIGRISEYQGPSIGTVRVNCNVCGGSGKN